MYNRKFLISAALCLFFLNMKGQSSKTANVSTKVTKFILPDGEALKNNNIDSLENVWGKGQILFKHSEDDDKNGIMHLVKKTSAFKDNETKSKKALALMLHHPAPQFELKDLEGNVWSLNELHGKTVILNFWFTSCAPCIKEIPELNMLVQQYKNKDVVFLALTYNTQQQVESFLKKRAFNYAQLTDSSAVIEKYNVFYFPTSFVIDKNGMVKGVLESSAAIYQDLKTIIDAAI